METKQTLKEAMGKALRDYADRTSAHILKTLELPYDPRWCKICSYTSYFTTAAMTAWKAGLMALSSEGEELADTAKIAELAKESGLVVKSRRTRHLLMQEGFKFYLYTENSDPGPRIECEWRDDEWSRWSKLRSGVRAEQYVALMEAFTEFMDDGFRKEYSRITDAQKAFEREIQRRNLIRGIERAAAEAEKRGTEKKETLSPSV